MAHAYLEFKKLTAKILLRIVILLVGATGSLLQADEVQLMWTDNSDNEEGFVIERSSADGVFAPIASVEENVVSYTDTTIVPGVDYSYRVNAFNFFGSSEYTNVVAHYINLAPSISTIAAQEVEAGESLEGIAFTVSDVENLADDLSVQVSSSHPDIIDASGILVSGTGNNKSLSLTPQSNGSGDVTITVAVSDGEDTTTISFLVAVLDSFVLPTLQLDIDTIAAQARAGESFTVSSVVSDSSSIASISYSVAGQLVGSVTEAPYSLSFGIAEPGSYTISAVASLDGRDATVSASMPVTIGSAPTASDIVNNLKDIGLEGSDQSVTASYDPESDSFYLEDESGTISGDSDTHSYYYLRIEGDVSVSARVSDLQAASTQSVAGLMLRSALYGPAQQTSLLLNSDGSLMVRSRESRGGSTSGIGLLDGISGDAWLKIVREGVNLRYYNRDDSETEWTQLHTQVLDLGNEIFVGFAVAGGASEGIASAAFSSASLDGQIMNLGPDAKEPEIPSGLTISAAAD